MKNQYTVNKDLVKSWAKEFIINGSASIIALAVQAIIFLCGAALIWMGFAFNLESKGIYLILGAYFIFYSIYRLFFSRFVVWNKRYKQLSEIYGVNEWQRTIEFLDEEIALTEHNSTNKLQYKSIKTIKEHKDMVFIFLEGGASIRLYKNAFIDCTWEECKVFIESKR